MSIEKWKAKLILTVCAIGIFFAIPNIMTKQALRSMPAWFPKSQLSLGLDLQGGSYLLLEVDMNVVDRDFFEQISGIVLDSLKSHKVIGKVLNGTFSPSNREITIKLDKKIDSSLAKSIVKQIDENLGIDVFDDKLVITVTDAALAYRHEDVLARSLEIVRKRVDEEGTKEPIIQKVGSDRILLQMPGIQDPSKVKEILGRTAKMTFQIVDDTMPEIYEGESRRPKMGVVYLPLESKGNDPARLLPINRKILVNGDALVDAAPGFDNYNNAQVSFRFNSVGAKQFAKITRQYVNRRLAIVLDDKVISAPQIREAITGGSGVINGNFSVEEANDLSLLLRSGALPAPLLTVEERTVGPDLGSDSIKAGFYATLLSILCVVVFMFLEYGIFGAIADIAVIFNIIFLIAAMSLIQATLTLPGIAGIALTVGMAVDANVLINERAREEQRKGIKALQAINSGYKMAMKTILDSHVTTLFGASALYLFGTGPVKGFAVTLTFGIIISLFTSVWLTKLIKVYWVGSKRSDDIVIP